ncbi:MAG: FAD-binding protein [Desulfarculaceae bacterium]|nr:FAD-binding protein [Desulfarculaceae bacterium]MCF8101562.1 FAD-binding protein [Desulfarculaceae bacterium]MCF8115112.1 FAD-binding protein [Desulfarculaceae bacterium]
MHKSDVVIIGAGLAGIMAAAQASEAGASVLLVDRGGVGLGTNSAMSNGYFCGPTDEYSLESYVEDTIDTGRGLNRRSYVERVGAQARAAFAYLAELGVPLTTLTKMYAAPTPRQDVIRGVSMMSALGKALRGRQGLSALTGLQVRRLLKRGDRVVGLEGLDAQGEVQHVAAKAVILACGGAGAVYAVNDNMKAIMGQGYTLAAQAGLPLMDLEFVQFYPLVLVEPGLPPVMLYPPYPAGSRLLNAAGEDILERHGLDDVNLAIQGLRDKLSIIIAQEARSGPVRMDFTQVAGEHWDKYPLGLLSHMSYDFRARGVAIMPGAHFCMGGVEVDAQGATALPGLFSCGEMVWGLHGANRRGGNALTECLVSGRLAGRGAAQYAQDADLADPPKTDTAPPSLATSVQGNPLRRLRDRLREITWQRAGIVRDGENLGQGQKELAAWSGELARAQAANPRQEWLRWDLECGGRFVAGVMAGSLARRESRGALLRQEHPGQDDQAWRTNSRLELGPEGAWSVSHQAVEG